MSIILIKKDWNKQNFLADQEVGGKKKGRTAGSWVDELASMKKVITLCPLCTNKFNPAKVGFKREKDIPYCQATCDGCSVKNEPKCSWYIYEETYDQVRFTRDEQRAWIKRQEDAKKRGYYK